MDINILNWVWKQVKTEKKKVMEACKDPVWTVKEDEIFIEIKCTHGGVDLSSLSVPTRFH